MLRLTVSQQGDTQTHRLVFYTTRTAQKTTRPTISFLLYSLPLKLVYRVFAQQRLEGTNIDTQTDGRDL
jgi:hypothetical protein